ncbi:MAG TPA: hypothetical protein VK506_12745 [Conexibacter sp.]|nr:hypothetical protein [Conexibacter sp.]
MKLIRARHLLVATVAAAALLVAASAAPAAMSVTSVDVSLTTTQAGGHPDLSITTNFGGDNTQIGGPGATNPVADSPSIYEIHLPPGLNGNPLAAPTCPLATFLADACPPETAVGRSLQGIFILFAPPGRQVAALPGVIYNLETESPDQAAMLGVRTITANPAPPPTTLTASLVPFALTISPSDYGLDSINLEPLTAVSRIAGPIRITSLGLTLNGSAFNGFFTSNPTACTPIQVSVSATSNARQTATGQSAPFTPTGCGTLPFDVGLATQLSTTQTDVPVQTGVSVTMPASDDPRRQSAVLESTVVLPEGMTVNPSIGNGLEACTDAQFNAADRTTAAACPAASQIGTVSFATPLFEQVFSGPVYYGERTPTTFNRLFVDVPIPGIHLKLTGNVTLNASNGQVTTTFQNLPQLPFTSFDLTFQGGPRSVLVNPQACGPHTATSNNTPFARLTDATPLNATPSSTFTTSFDGAGAPCQSLFQPWFIGTPSNARAGADTTFALKFGRPDRNKRIGSVLFRLPAGLVGDLTLDGLVKCTRSAANGGSCPTASKLGTATVEAGSGPAPVSLPGEVFLTEPLVRGDPAGLSVKVPAKIGPVDLGNVIVPVRLELRSNGGLNPSAGLPQFEDGVPVSARLANIEITREGFMRNPTACGKRSFSGVFSAVGGGSATTRAAFTLADCRALGFSPRIAVRLGARGKTRTNAHPPMTATITQGGGQSAINRARVLLPRAIRSNLTGIGAACTQEQFDADRCSPNANGGRATATSPFVDEPLRGPVWLVRRERGQLPKLVAKLSGPLDIEVVGYPDVSDSGKIVTTFRSLPDVPVTRFTLKLDSGRFGFLEAAANLCARPLAMPSTFRAWNGKNARRRPGINVQGCGSGRG